MKNILIYFALAASMLVLNGCNERNTQNTAPKITTTKTIKDRGTILIGVKGDTYKFGYKDPYTGIIDGFDVDVAKALAKKILGDEKKLKTIAVTTASRGPMLNSDELDYVIATFTITEDRKKIFNFSNPYFVDSGIGMMVKKDSGIRSIKDLNNKRVGVAAGTTAVKSMQDAAVRAGIKINLVEYDIYPSVKAALNADDVDCFATNGIILLSYMDDNVMLLDERLAPQAYGIVSKKGNNELTQAANEVIESLNISGEINNIIAKWGLQ
ncbi:MAG: transporter substrate-binding domain-containing protein [Campylobacteraceae bacterium]|jgi:putative glutamine transport system substrate-binding protein|nr:transporter substrate-binding domain-containing protein [Campylobacteraceae bacterium]